MERWSEEKKGRCEIPYGNPVSPKSLSLLNTMSDPSGEHKTRQKLRLSYKGMTCSHSGLPRASDRLVSEVDFPGGKKK